MSSLKQRRSSQAKITFRPFHTEQKRIYKELSGRDVLRCGRRFGKTTLAEDAGGNWAVKGLKVGWFSPNYKLLIPSYKRILKTIRPMVSHANRMDGLIELTNGGEVEFWTLNDEDAGRSRSYDYVIVDEASLVKKGLRDIWEKSIAPTLLDRKGRALMAGTPKGIDPENFFYEACTNKSLGWKEFHAPTCMNPTLDAVGVANLENDYPPLVYLQEFQAKFVDWGGNAYFAEPWILVAQPDGSFAPVQYPKHCASVYAVIDSATKDGKEHDGTAVTFYSFDPYQSGHKLTILDWDIIQISGDLLENWLPGIFARLDVFAQQCGARMGSLGTFIEDKGSGIVLNQQASRRGWPSQPLDSAFTAVGKEGRALSMSGYVFKGEIKISEYAYNKQMNYKGQTRNHFLSQVLGFRPGLKDGEDDLLDTFCYGVAVGMGDTELW